MKPLIRPIRAAVLATAAALFISVGSLSAAVKLPAVLSDSMVLQQGQPVPVWGWADKGEEVTVTFAGQTAKAKAGDDGAWRVVLKPLTASDQPAELSVAGSAADASGPGSGPSAIKLKDILVGEVWICSGQSNMEFVVKNAKDSAKEIADAKYPNIRLFTVPKSIKTEPQSDTKGNWVACSPETVGSFSAVGYFFGRALHQDLKVPVGLIHTSWGGTPAEAWATAESIKGDPELAPMIATAEARTAGYPQAKEAHAAALAKWKEAAEKAKKEGKPVPQAPRGPREPGNDPNVPAVLYNGMVAPIVGFANKGTIWYQGESNAGRAYQYRKLLPTMIASWRDAWTKAGAEKDTKFLIVQLANFQKPAEKPGDDAWAELREAQTMTAAMPNNGMAIAIDLADADKPEDIHPHNKQDVGKRLELVALGKFYGKSDVVYAGPTFESMKIEGGKAIIKLSSAAGLVARGDGKVKGFAIAGQDKAWHWADAKIEGDTIVLSSDQVSKPVAVRYAWSINPVTNLYNAAGLPAAPFRTDDWPGVTAPKK